MSRAIQCILISLNYSKNTETVLRQIRNNNKFQFDLDVRHFSHEPLARVIAQALPVLDVKSTFTFLLKKHPLDVAKKYVETYSSSNAAARNPEERAF